MATRTIALTVLAQEYAQQIVPQINRTAVGLRVIPTVVGGGANVSWVAKGDGSTAAAMAEGASAGTPSNDVQRPATLNWAYYKSDGGATGPAQAAAASTSSPDHDLLANDVADSVASLASQMNAHLYSGDGTASPKELTGFDQAIGDTTNTYANIVRGTYTWFQPKVFNPTVATAFTLSQARSDISQIKQACGEAPNLALVHPDVFTSIAGAFDANRTYAQAVTSTFADSRQGLIKLDASVGAVHINGCTFIEDKDATLESGGTSGRIYYINTRYVELVIQMQAEIMPLLQAAGIRPGMTLQANDGFGQIPLLAAVVAMAKTADADTFMTKTYAELRVRKPSACGVRRFVAVGT